MLQTHEKDQNDIVLAPGTLKEQLSVFSEEQLQQIVQQANQWAAFTRQMQLMDGVARDMKVIPELPSEILRPKDTSALSKIDFPEEGGVLTSMDGFEYPFRGFPHHDFVDKIDSIKKFSRQLMSGFYHQLKETKKIKFVTLLPSLWVIKVFLRSYVYVIYRVVERFLIKPERYCQFIREFYRAFSIERPGELEKERQFRLHLRDTLCMIMEFDNAYRFRAQDILPEVSKEALRKNPAKELLRLFNLMSSREHQQEVKDTWKLLKLGIRLYLKFDKNLCKLIQHVFTQLDLEKVKLSIEDIEYCTPRSDYTFGFKANPTSEQERLIHKYAVKSKLNESREKVWKESNDAHQILFEFQKKEVNDLQTRIKNLPKEEEERLNAKLNQITKEYNDELQRIIKELQKKYESRHNKIVDKMSNPEISALYQKHLEERQIMDKKYNKLLEEAEKIK